MVMYDMWIECLRIVLSNVIISSSGSEEDGGYYHGNNWCFIFKTVETPGRSKNEKV